MNTDCESCDYLEHPSPFRLLRTEYWNVELGHNQAYAGRAFVTLRSHKGSLAELSPEEWADFAEVVRKLEGAYRKALGAAPFNWSCLMNNAYKQKPYTPHVHWHLLPRYEKPVQIGDLTLEDGEFGHMFAPHKERLVDDQVVMAIAEKIKQHLG